MLNEFLIVVKDLAPSLGPVLTFILLLFSIIAWIRKNDNHKKKLAIKKARPEHLNNLLQTLSGKLNIPLDGLSESAKLELVKKELDQREAHNKRIFFLSVLILLFLFIILLLNLSRSEKPPSPAISNYPSSCLDQLKDNPNSKSDFYKINPNHSHESGVFKVFCDMETEKGGWTLYANHKDGLPSIKTIDLVETDSYGVLSWVRWMRLLRTMKIGKMFVDEKGLVSLIGVDELKQPGVCVDLDGDLAGTKEHGSIWRRETNDCDFRDPDMSAIQLSSLGDRNYKINGASLYSYNKVGFKKWPYDKPQSYEYQDELKYYIK